MLAVREVGYTWYPPRQVESLYADSIARFEVLPSKIVKVGSCALGLFLRRNQASIEPSDEPIGIYTGRFPGSEGDYLFEATAGSFSELLDGTPHSDHPMTCFGRINDDIYDNNYNVRFRADGSIVVICTIRPGDELSIDYGDGYTGNWNWIKQDALRALATEILDMFPFVQDLDKDISLEELFLSSHPLHVAMKGIITGDAWTENMHSLSVDPHSKDVLGLCLFLSAGVTFEKFRFGGWGSSKVFPVVVPKRGQTGFFCDAWNKTSTAVIDPSILLSPSRKRNGPIRELLSSLKGIYSETALIRMPLSPQEVPNIAVRRNRITLTLDLGSGNPRRRKIEDLLDHSSVESLLTHLNTARIWTVKIEKSREECLATPGRGFCGFISMDRIINGMDRTLDPVDVHGVGQMLEVIKSISDLSCLPLRKNWRKMNHMHLSAKERLASTAQHLCRNRSDWLAMEYLPEQFWLNGGSLVNSCRHWGYSRWYTNPGSNDLLLEESEFRLSNRISLTELTKVVESKMLCYDSDTRHFYTRQGALSVDLLEATSEALDILRSSIKLKPATALSSQERTSVLDLDEPSDNCHTPVSSWDGLLTAELLLRPNNDHRILDLSCPSDRSKMASAVRNMDFLDSHDAHSIAQNLDEFPPGVIPDAPKMSVDEMKKACCNSNATFIVIDKGIKTVINEGFGETVNYNRDSNRYYLESVEPPEHTAEQNLGTALIAISWNCNSWDVHKAQKLSSLAETCCADVILVTDARIDEWRLKLAVDSFSKTLQKATGKIWGGEATAKHPLHRAGGNLIMYSNRVCRPKIKHLMPLGTLSSLDGRWKDQDFSFLSVYRPPLEGTDTSLRALVNTDLGTDMEDALWERIESKMDEGLTWLCGDFNLSPTKLDERLLSMGHYNKRVPYTGDHYSFRRWDSVNENLQQSSIDHVVWNGVERTSCSLATDGGFTLDHVPVIVNTHRLSDLSAVRPLEFKRLPTLNCNDKGACRKFISEMNRVVNSLNDDLSHLSIQEITRISVETVGRINKRRNNKRSPSIWSPIAHLLNLRISAIGSTVRANIKSNYRPLKALITRLKRDEAKITLNEAEAEWLEDNGVRSDPLDWNEWINEYADVTHAARELLRIKKLLSSENRKEFRRIHGERMAKIQGEADAGRIGGVIRHIMGGTSSYTMESIRDEGLTITDGERIASLVTAFFAKWFSRLPDEKERDRKLAECVLNEDKLSWDSLMAATMIPGEVGDTLWLAFQPRPLSSEGLIEAADLADYVPSLYEFKKYIDTLNPRSAPGFSGLSYLMVKLWPDAMVERAYDCLRDAWKNKVGLEGWGTRLLAPIPKKPDPELKDLRPLMLVEVMRKIWVGLVTNRISAFWDKFGLVNPSQHAYLRNRGTHTAIPQLINAMETAKEYNTDIFISSWDMSKAFDNLSREMILLSLRRLHVPLVIAEYLISLDVDGKVLVRTPWLLDRLREKDPSFSKGEFFITEKGVGQGDIPSPLLWVAAFDIPLVALAAVPSDFKTQDIACNASNCVDIAYADDLVSIVASTDVLQSKADVMSAWCLLSNVKMNTTKLRTFGLRGEAGRDSTDKLIIHGERWEEIVVSITTVS